MKVGISFVSVANAATISVETQVGRSTRSRRRPPASGTASWTHPGRRRHARPAAHLLHALYHSLLAPNVVSDVNGQYTGRRRPVHASTGRASTRTSPSGTSTARDRAAVVARTPAGRRHGPIAVNDAEQVGWLPKWAIVGGDASQMNGDSADPIIAAAYAFGVRGFDVNAALAAMVKGANETESGHGLEIERQYLDQYVAQHYVDAGSLDLDSIDYSDRGSVTLEYAIDDFSIAQIAWPRETIAVRDHDAAGPQLAVPVQPGDGYSRPAIPTGASPPVPPSRPRCSSRVGSRIRGGERDPVHLVGPSGSGRPATSWAGTPQAVKKLDTFFTELNAGRDRPFDWAGNEPSLWTPWEYDYFGAPSQTQGVVRKIADDPLLRHPGQRTRQRRPGGDLVVVRVGRHRPVPGHSRLGRPRPGQPPVPRRLVTLPDGRKLVMHAPSASASTPYIHSLTLAGAGASGPRRPVRREPRTVRPVHPWARHGCRRRSSRRGDPELRPPWAPTPRWGSDPHRALPRTGPAGTAVGYSPPSGGTTSWWARPRR